MLRHWVKQALEASLVEASNYIQKSTTYKTNSEVEGDLFTRLNRHLKLTPLGNDKQSLLCRDNISTVKYNRTTGIEWVYFTRSKWGRSLEVEVVDTLQSLIDTREVDISIINLDASLSNIINQVQEYKI